MAFLQNTTRFTSLPLRYIGGSPGTFRALWGRSSCRNSTVGEGITTQLAGIPAGHYPPSSWNLPYKAGQMSAFTFQGITFTTGNLNVAAGVNLDGNTTFTFTVGPSLLQLIVSASGSTSITFTLTGGAAAVIEALGGIAFEFTVGPSTLGAVSDLTAGTIFTFTSTATPKAIGNLAGNVTPFTPLSPQSLAAAVWEALSADYNTAGTMGNKLNSAASAGDPWSTALPGGYGAGEAGYILGNRVLTEDDINKIADVVLRRSTANVETSSDGDAISLKSLYGMVAQGVHNTQVSGASLTVTKSDDTTVLGTRTVTTDSTAEPIVGIDSD